MTISSPPRITETTRIVLPGLVEPSGLVLETGPVGTPRRGQLLVQVEATGISFAEHAMRLGRYFAQPAFPFTPGYDLVGRVLEVGEGGDRTLLGRRVAAMTKTGAWTGHAIVAARDSVLVPDGIEPEQAEAVLVNGVTAWQMLHRAARVRPGQTILVFGANSGVGGILIQLAQHHGVRVIGAASPRHHEALRANGVIPVDYADPALESRVRELAPGGVDAVFDNVGGATTRMSFRPAGARRHPGVVRPDLGGERHGRAHGPVPPGDRTGAALERAPQRQGAPPSTTFGRATGRVPPDSVGAWRATWVSSSGCSGMV